MKTTMKLEGFESLQRALVQAPALVKVHASGAIDVSTTSLASRARAKAPVKTGALKKAIVASRVRTGLTGTVGLGEGPADGPRFYWRFVEFGTVHQRAQPFFRPAADAEAPDYIKRLKDIGPKLERDLSASRLV